MFQKILIANRGEIACRVIRTARKMGIATVAVYSEADRDALHVISADEAVCIGPALATQSYLHIDNILRACTETGADAVHPGYGFLSENGEFAKRLADAGIVFIGPNASAISSMGDKLTSKLLAKQAGVNTVPGHEEPVFDADDAVRRAREIGYPIMLKASAGGGGKGMRIAHNDEECRSGLERAANEARSSFGDDRILVEKFIELPRHIEIQVIGDKHGNVIYLGERECSLQRRHQKVVEEAPSPFLDEETRAAMGAQAVALAQAVNYDSAGTVEFIVDQNRQFYFLEMNTRLQVEHPITEYVTGYDLVEMMIRVAAGEPLSVSQADVSLTGWSVEARVYAEDPYRGFLPSIGRLVRYLPPPTSELVRLDTGVYEGSEISMHYDPMIAKLVTYAETREAAIDRLIDALNEFYIRGVETNLSFLSALINQEAFRKGDIHTGLIGDLYPDGFNAWDVVHDAPKLLIATCATIHRRYRERALQITDQLVGYERKVADDWVVIVNDVEHPVKVTANNGAYDVSIGDETLRVTTDWQFGQPLFRAEINGEAVCIQVERRNMIYRLSHWGARVDAMVLSARATELYDRMPRKQPADMTKFVQSPMPGLLAALKVAVGDEVKTGQDVAVVEAMKMENVLRSERNGIVVKLHAAVGDTLEVDEPIVEFE